MKRRRRSLATAANAVGQRESARGAATARAGTEPHVRKPATFETDEGAREAAIPHVPAAALYPRGVEQAPGELPRLGLVHEAEL